LQTIHKDLTKVKNMNDYGKKGLSDTLNRAYAKFYNHLEHLTVDEVIAKFKNKVIFRHTLLRKEHVSTTDDRTATYATVKIFD